MPTFTPAATIDEVVARLDAVIDQARRDNSRLGLFACLYPARESRNLPSVPGGRLRSTDPALPLGG